MLSGCQMWKIWHVKLEEKSMPVLLKHILSTWRKCVFSHKTSKYLQPSWRVRSQVVRLSSWLKSMFSATGWNCYPSISSLFIHIPAMNVHRVGFHLLSLPTITRNWTLEPRVIWCYCKYVKKVCVLTLEIWKIQWMIGCMRGCDQTSEQTVHSITASTEAVGTRRRESPNSHFLYSRDTMII